MAVSRVETWAVPMAECSAACSDDCLAVCSAAQTDKTLVALWADLTAACLVIPRAVCWALRKADWKAVCLVASKVEQTVHMLVDWTGLHSAEKKEQLSVALSVPGTVVSWVQYWAAYLAGHSEQQWAGWREHHWAARTESNLAAHLASQMAGCSASQSAAQKVLHLAEHLDVPRAEYWVALTAVQTVEHWVGRSVHYLAAPKEHLSAGRLADGSAFQTAGRKADSTERHWV